MTKYIKANDFNKIYCANPTNEENEQDLICYEHFKDIFEDPEEIEDNKVYDIVWKDDGNMKLVKCE